MRAVLVATVAILLAGCLEGPAPSPGADPTPQPPTSTPTPTQSPTPPTPASPRVTTAGDWTYVVTPGELKGYVGDAIRYVAEVKGPARAEGTLSLNEPWGDPSRPRAEIERGEARIDGVVHLGASDRLSAMVWDGTEHHNIEGPELVASGVERTAEFERFTNVSSHAPGLTVDVEGRTVRVTFAAKENVTDTGGEDVSASSRLMLVDAPEGRRLVAFVTLAYNDAISFLPEPQRSRVVAEMTDVPEGPLDVRVITSVICFCAEFPPAGVHEKRVVVG